MNIAIVGRYRADRLAAALRRRGASRFVLCGPVDVAAFVGKDVDYRYLAADAPSEAILSLLSDTAVDLLVPSLYPLEQEQMLPTLASACLTVTDECRSCVHSPQFAEAVSDKVAFHELAIEHGWPVPDAVVSRDPTRLATAVAAVGLPALIKTGRSLPWAGRYYLKDAAALTDVPEMEFPVLVQRACRGEEFGVELLTGRDGRTTRWPVASFGPLDEHCMPGRRTRIMPAALPDAARRQLDTVIDGITTTLSPYGPWQIDLAVEDEQLRILELNGRFSGMAHLSRYATGVDPYDALAGTVLETMPELPAVRRAAAEIPLALGWQVPPLPAGMHCEPQLPSPTEPCLPTHFRRTLVTAEDTATLRSWITALPADALADATATNFTVSAAPGR